MKKKNRFLCAVLAVMFLLAGLVLLAPRAYAAEYQDGTYTVPFSVDGLGRHNIAWSTATVTVSGDTYYVTFTLERVDPRNHAPQYDWLATDCGSYTPVTDDASYTCTFSNVQVPHLGAVNVTAQSSGMSQPHEIDYTLHIDASSIPLASAASGSDTSGGSGSGADSSGSTDSSGSSGASDAAPTSSDTAAAAKSVGGTAQLTSVRTGDAGIVTAAAGCLLAFTGAGGCLLHLHEKRAERED